MHVLIAIPKTYGQLQAVNACDTREEGGLCACSCKVTKVAEHENLGEIVAIQTQIEQDHQKYIKHSNELAKTKPVSFEKYEGTAEEYKAYREKLDQAVKAQFHDLKLSVPCYFGCDLIIL